MLDRSGAANSPNVRRSSGSTSRNSCADSDASQPSRMPSSSRSWASSRPLPDRKPSAQCGLVRGLDADGERGGEPARPPAGGEARRRRPAAARSARRPGRARRAARRARTAPSSTGPALARRAPPARAAERGVHAVKRRPQDARRRRRPGPPAAAGSPAQTRTVSASTTAASAPVSVPRTFPYRTARTRAGTAAIRRVTSDSVGGRGVQRAQHRCQRLRAARPAARARRPW